MPSLRRARLKAWQSDRNSAPSSHHSETSTSLTAPVQEAPIGDLANPQAMSSNQMLHMQRVMGNQAVMRLLDRRGPAHISRNAPGTATIQRLPSYVDFLKGARKMAKVRENIFTAEPGRKALQDARERNPQRIPDLKPTEFLDADISAAYQRYETDQTLTSLIKLFDSITYWEALNHSNREEKWYENIMFYLSGIKESIRSDIQDRTTQMYGTQADVDALKNTAAIRANQDQQWSAMMPPFLKEVGVAPHYFRKHLLDHPERVEKLREFSDALRDGDLTGAAIASQFVANVPGMYLIKPLFIHKYAANAGLESLVGTNMEANPEPLTQEEAQAILMYSAGDYTAMNNDLRNTAVKDPNQPMRDQSALAVSGMNKLPPFKGIAYRAQVTDPGDYFDVIQPGAAVVDLAFQSASPSLTGVAHYLGSKRYGTHHIYLMVHTQKSAVNIIDKAAIPVEGEVLFKPGVRFVVKAVWHHVLGRVPPNAPAEAQMILHAQSEFKHDLVSGQAHQVKVIEMVEQ